jgi:hypothetical protein
MLKRNALLFVAFLVAAPAISAQHSVPAPLLGRPPSDPGLTLSVTGFVAPGAPGALPLPTELMERISRETHLTALETVPSAGGRTAIQMRFRFPDVAAFNRWYRDERTVALLRDVRERTAGGSYDAYVSYHPERITGEESALAGALAITVDRLMAGVCAPPPVQQP